jgi:hypothetical protein
LYKASAIFDSLSGMFDPQQDFAFSDLTLAKLSKNGKYIARNVIVE